MKHDVIVVGAGLFGATIARALRRRGLSVLVFDDSRPYSGSRASGSLMKPSWFDGLGKAVYEPGLAELHDTYRVRELEFTVAPKLFRTKVLWVPTVEILDRGDLNLVGEKVLDIREGFVRTEGVGLGWVEYEARHIVVAAGHWCAELLPEVKVRGLAGVSLRWTPGRTDNTINPWAPYKQIVRFTEELETPSVWAGDGSAIVVGNWTPEREAQSYARVVRFVGAQGAHPVATAGVRPYCDGVKAALVKEVRPGVWVATGGAKNGLVGAGWAARQLAERLAS